MAKTQTRPKQLQPVTIQKPPAAPVGPADGMQQRASKKVAYDAAKAAYLDLENPKPDMPAIARAHKVDIALLMQLSVRESWDSLRSAALAQRELGAADLRLEAVRRVDRAIVGTIEEVAHTAGRAYVDLIQQIAMLPSDVEPGLAPAAGKGPDSWPEEPDTEKPNTNEKLKTQSIKTKQGPRIKPLLLIKVGALNEATEGFSKFALALRDLGMVLIPEKAQPESAGSTGNGQLAPATLIQINQMLSQAMPKTPPLRADPEPIDIKDDPPPPPPPV